MARSRADGFCMREGLVSTARMRQPAGRSIERLVEKRHLQTSAASASRAPPAQDRGLCNSAAANFCRGRVLTCLAELADRRTSLRQDRHWLERPRRQEPPGRPKPKQSSSCYPPWFCFFLRLRIEAAK